MRPALRLLFLAASLRATIAERTLWLDSTEQELGTALRENDRTLVVFSSRTFEAVQPVHEVLGKLADDRYIRTPIVLIDCDVEEELCRRNDVNEYPAMRLFEKKVSHDTEQTGKRYRGRKTEHAIRSFLIKHELPVLSELGALNNLRKFREIDDIVVVAFLSTEDDQQIFRSMAEEHHEDVVFGYTSDLLYASEEGVTIPSIKCYKNTDGDHKLLAGAFTKADVETLLESASKTAIGDFSERTMDTYMAVSYDRRIVTQSLLIILPKQPGKLSAYLFATTEDEARALRHELTPLAKKYLSYVTFGVADAVEYAPMARNFGLVEDSFPALAVHAPMNDNVFIYEQRRAIRRDVVEQMLVTILQGKATTGQVFGEEAPAREDEDVEAVRGRRDEL